MTHFVTKQNNNNNHSRNNNHNGNKKKKKRKGRLLCDNVWATDRLKESLTGYQEIATKKKNALGKVKMAYYIWPCLTEDLCVEHIRQIAGKKVEI